MSRNVRKRTFWHVRLTKIQISLCIRAALSEFAVHMMKLHHWLSKFRHEDSDQTARMRRLIWIFAGRTFPKVRFLTLQLKCIIGYVETEQ